MYRGAIYLTGLLLAAGLHAQPADNWWASRNAHFEVYSQESAKAAQNGLEWLEELRAFVAEQTGLNPDSATPLRVIAFRSPHEYSEYRVHQFADAYYVGSGSRNYLMLPSLDGPSFGTAAHEYSHFLFHLAGLELPPWLREGMAEVFASVRVTSRGSQIGGDLPARADLLRRTRWLPLEDVLRWSEKSPLQDDRDAIGRFYSQSWALAEMLALAPDYRPGFRRLVTAVATGTPGAEAIFRVYGKSLDQVAADLRVRTGQRRPVALRSAAVPTPPRINVPAAADISLFHVRLMLAEVLFLAQEFDHSEQLYNQLRAEAPNRADVTAGLGAVALSRGDRDQAQRLWKRAIQQGITDPEISYRYALLLDTASTSPDELRQALELVIRLRPGLEDARFRLALLEENAGRHEAALVQLDAIANPSVAHAYPYWCAKAQALLGLERNEPAEKAALQAAHYAANTEERAHALEIAWMARTHPAVRFTRDADGKLVLSTTRAPNDASDWNAFVEPGDDMRRAEGTLVEIECGEPGLRLHLDTAAGRLAVAIPDPLHVQMRHAPAEFTCGPQQPRPKVVVEYAAPKSSGADGIARGVEFRD